MGLFPRAHTYCAATCATCRLLGRQQHCNTAYPNARVFSILRMDDAPHIRGYLLFLLSIQVCLPQCHPICPTTRTRGLRHLRGGEHVHRERFLVRGARQLSRHQSHRCSIWPRRRQTTRVMTWTALRSLRARTTKGPHVCGST